MSEMSDEFNEKRLSDLERERADLQRRFGPELGGRIARLDKPNRERVRDIEERGKELIDQHTKERDKANNQVNRVGPAPTLKPSWVVDDQFREQKREINAINQRYEKQVQDVQAETMARITEFVERAEEERALDQPVEREGGTGRQDQADQERRNPECSEVHAAEPAVAGNEMEPARSAEPAQAAPVEPMQARYEQERQMLEEEHRLQEKGFQEQWAEQEQQERDKLAKMQHQRRDQERFQDAAEQPGVLARLAPGRMKAWEQEVAEREQARDARDMQETEDKAQELDRQFRRAHDRIQQRQAEELQSLRARYALHEREQQRKAQYLENFRSMTAEIGREPERRDQEPDMDMER